LGHFLQDVELHLPVRIAFHRFRLFGGREPLPGDHTALVELNGVIAADTHAKRGRDYPGTARRIREQRHQSVILRINSPGGSPFQAGTINSEIHRLRQNIRKYRFMRWWKISALQAAITLPWQRIGSMSIVPASSVRSVC